MDHNSQLKILLVEDDLLFREIVVSQIFENIQISPLTSSNGLEAEALLDQWQPNVLITDTNMPQKNGIELIKYARTKVKDIVIFSLFEGLIGSDITETDVISFGANMVITKKEIGSHLLPALKLLKDQF